MTGIGIHFISDELTYDGAALSPRWLFKKLKATGSAIAFFIGPCNVSTEQMVDIEDRLQENCIKARRMVHLIGEFLEWPISKTVLLQNLLILWIRELIEQKCGVRLTRSGNDLFINNRKLSVSIAAASVGSSLIHIGINVDPTGAPVEAIGLQELGLNEVDFVRLFTEKLRSEFTLLEKASLKSLPVLSEKH